MIDEAVLLEASGRALVSPLGGFILYQVIVNGTASGRGDQAAPPIHFGRAHISRALQ